MVGVGWVVDDGKVWRGLGSGKVGSGGSWRVREWWRKGSRGDWGRGSGVWVG